MRFIHLVQLLQADHLRLGAPSFVRYMLAPLNPRFIPVLLVRLSRFFWLSKWFRFLSPIFTWLNVLLFGLEFTPRCDVGPGLMLPHTVGTVVGAYKIGSNVTIFQGVTLGAQYADLTFTSNRRPILADGVTVGAGAMVLGGIFIGKGATIAANSLVIGDVEEGATMIGVPAVARESRGQKI